MNKRRFFIGPGAPSLMLAVVVVSMSVLGLLALMSARNDLRLANRTIDFTAAQYEAMAQSQRTLAKLDEIVRICQETAADDEQYLALIRKALPDGMTMDGRRIIWTEAMMEGHELRVALQIAPHGTLQTRLIPVENLFVSSGWDEEWE